MNLVTTEYFRKRLAEFNATRWAVGDANGDKITRIYLTDIISDIEKLCARVKELESALKKARDEADGCAEDRHYYGVYLRHKELVMELDSILGGFQTNKLA